MATITTFSKVALLILCGWGFFATLIFSSKNGLFITLEEIKTFGLLPYTSAGIRTKYTGVKALDDHLSMLVTFFWTMIDGTYPDVSLHSVDFLGQGAAAWVVCVIEGSRSGNKGRLASYVAIMGILVQNMSFAVTMPAYLALHLFTSPTVSGSDKRSLVSKARTVSVVPFSIILGYLLPAHLMSLPAPSVISYDRKQIFAAIFQPFPILVFALGWTAETFLNKISNNELTEQSEMRKFQKSLRIAYAFGFACSAIGHIASWTLSLSAVLIPKVFAYTYEKSFHPCRTFLNTSPLSGAALDLGTGVLSFLQWDLFTGSTALLIWAVTLHTNAQVARGKSVEWVSTLSKAFLYALFAGPCGAALKLVWERDEFILGQPETKEKEDLLGRDSSGLVGGGNVGTGPNTRRFL